MKIPFQIVLAAAAAFALSTAPIAARAQAPAQAAPAQPGFSKADQAQLARVESYLNGIGTLRADFLQVASTGEVARGTFYLRRPGRLRVEYEPAVPVLIVADGHRLIYYDKELDTVQMVPIDRTLAAFLARPTIRFGEDVTVTGFARERGLIRVTVVQRREPDAGSLTLVFDEAPLRLRQWIVTDAQGIQTRVALQETEWDVTLRNELFEIPRPEEKPW